MAKSDKKKPQQKPPPKPPEPVPAHEQKRASKATIDGKPFTPEELSIVRGMSQVRLPYPMMAVILGFGSTDTFERRIKSEPALREAIDRGRANASGNCRNNLYGMQFDKTLPPAVRLRAAEFWASTQEGFKKTDGIELTGAGGGPVDVATLTPTERKKALMALDKKLGLTEDEG